MRRQLIPLMCLTLLCAVAREGFADLIGYWPLDEGGGSQVTDTTGNGHDGSITDATWVSPGWDGRGACLQFDGVDDVVVVPHADDLRFDNGSAYTVAAWVDMTVRPGHWSGIVTKGRDTGSWYGIWVDPGNQWVFGHDGDNQLGSAVEADVWIHVAMVYDSGLKRIYLDGKLDAETSASMTGDNTGDLWFGAAKGVTEFAPARIDDIRIYDHALSAADVKALVPPKLKAYEPNPPDGATGVLSPLLQWTAGDTARFHNVYLGTQPELTDADLVGARQPFAMYYHVLGIEPGVTYYWRVDEMEADMTTTHTGEVWSFTAMPLTAWAPDPADGAVQILQRPTLTWAAGQSALEHHLYLGTDPDAVGQGAAETDKGVLTEDETAYHITDSLNIDTTYYWRVDTTDLAGTVHTGRLWSFTTIAPGPGGAIREWWTGVSGIDIPTLTGDVRYPDEPSGRELVGLMEGPVGWADNYASRLSGWLYPTATGDYTFWISSDDNGELWLSSDADPANKQLIASVAVWTDYRQWDAEAGQVSAPQTLVAGRVYYIEALMNEGTGGDNLSVAWQGPGVPFGVIGADAVGPTAVYPVLAFAPSPADGAVDTIQSPILSWLAGEGASQHALYLGDDADAVANADTSTAGIFRGQQAATTYSTGPLEWGKTYYWRVDENSAAAPGTVWSFTTANFLNVEDFESYDDDIDGGTAVFQTWIDGVENGTGSYVGYDVANNGTFGETSIVHGGRQSVPLAYDNADPPYYSQTCRTFDVSQDWTGHGVSTLTLHIRGSAGNGPVPLYVVVEDNAGRAGVVVHPDPTIVTSTQWDPWDIPLGEFSNAGVNLASVRKICIGLGDRDNPAPGGAGLIYIDDIRVDP